MQDAINNHPDYAYDPSLGKAEQVLDHILLQMGLIEGIMIAKAESESLIVSNEYSPPPWKPKK